MLATYKLTDNKPQPLLRVKLSVGREGMLDIALAGAGQLAFVSADPIVRFYNLQSDDNYVRPPPTAADRRRVREARAGRRRSAVNFDALAR